MLLAFHNKEEIKAKTIKAMKADIEAERLVAGHYWNDKTGCFVGCVIRGSDHGKFETELGIPRIIARLGDCLFEGLWKYTGQESARTFCIDFLDAIPTGAYLSLVWAKFAVFLLTDKEHGVLQYAKKEETKKSIQNVSDVYQRMINGEKISTDQWQLVRKAASVAYASDATASDASASDAYAAASASDASDASASDASAAASAAYAAASAAEAYAFAAEAYAAAASDAYAAYAYASAAYAARSRRYTALATYLLQLFRESGKKLAA